ncbi:hypothetical protein, partial [Enterobacter sp.]|uniref:hypothetical protein n=1 Tax=Enterobacter sp. TaxID=42895 RepID=UPI00296F6C06
TSIINGSEVSRLSVAIHTMQRQVIKWGKNTRIVRKRTASERAAGTVVYIFDYTLSYREHCEIHGGVYAAAPGDEGFVDGIHSLPTIYVATNHFSGATFERSLRKSIYANTILCKFSFCLFGIGGTPGASHMHYHQNGQALVGSNLTSNFNTFEFCRFFNASGVDYATEVGDGFMINFLSCDFETNNAAVATVNNKGAYLVTFEFSWAERNGGVSFLRCAMDTTGANQGPLNQVFRNCWIKLDGSGNTCITNSATQNFNVSYERCAGSSYSGKVLTKVTGLPDDYSLYQSVQGCRFVGWSKQDDNDYMFGKLSTNTLSLKDTAGAINSLITGTASRMIMRHATGVSIQDMSGNVIGEIITTATGTQFRGKSQNGVSMKLQPPTDGVPGNAQWTVV